MTLPVFVAPVHGVLAGATVTLEGDEARHAAVVRRIRVGEQVVLVDGRGTSATGTVVESSRTTMSVEVSSVTSVRPPEPSVTVVQAIPKGDRGELAVEVLTEIGADRIVPWAAARCVAVWRGDRAAKSLARWRATAREAGKQSRRVWFPEVTDQAGTAAVVDLLGDADLAVVLHEQGAESLPSLSLEGVGSIVVVVGPEGGLNEEELASFAGAHVVRMGEPVLRTSTAGVAAVAALLAQTPRWA